jgi:glycosyltransferase involved in cell wall biosynthesis
VLTEHGYAYEVLVVDDGSTDNTAVNATTAGATVISHPYNIGNGAAVKTGIRHASGDILVMLDSDGQHPPKTSPACWPTLAATTWWSAHAVKNQTVTGTGIGRIWRTTG